MAFRIAICIDAFDVAVDGDAHGDLGDFHTGALELPREIGGGGFAFDSRIRGKASCDALMTGNSDVT
jgi:hypothetical protein